MLVGIVCPYDLGSPGGVQQLTIELAGQLRAHGEKAVLVGAGAGTHQGGPGLDASMVPAGRPVRVRANESIVPFTVSPLSWRRVRDALSGVDVIHLHEPFIPLVGWVAMTVDKPMVTTFHADVTDRVEALYRRVPWIGAKLRKGIITAVSPAAARAVPGRWGDVRIVPNAIDVASYAVDVGRVSRRVTFLGRDEPRKGLDILLRSWPKVREAVPDAELVVMGAARDTTFEGVDFRGRVSSGEKNRVLASSQVYVAPNTGGESFGIVVAEAMAAGCAVVASDLEAFRDVVGDDGRLVPVGDEDAFAESITALLADPAGARALGERARVSVGRFDWPVVMERYMDLYRQAIAM